MLKAQIASLHAVPVCATLERSAGRCAYPPLRCARAGMGRLPRRSRDPRRPALIGASAASQLGDWLYNAALLGYVYSATGSAGVGRRGDDLPAAPVRAARPGRRHRSPIATTGGPCCWSATSCACALMLALAAVVAADGPVVLVIALTALASAPGTAERPAAMAMLPRLVGESRLGAGQRAPAHGAGPRRRRRSGDRGDPARRRAPMRWRSSSTGPRSRRRRRSSRRCARRARPRGATAGREHRAQLTHGLRTARTTPFVVPLFVVVAMAELTYGAQTVQLVLYAERAARRSAPAATATCWPPPGVGGLLSAIVNARLAASTKVVAHRRRRRRAVLRHAARVRVDDLARVALLVDPARRRRLRRLRGGRRDGPRPRRAIRGAGSRHGRVRRRCRWRRWSLGAVLAPVLIAGTSLRTSFARPRRRRRRRHLRVPGRAPRARRAEPAARRGARVAGGGHRAAPDHRRRVPRIVLEQLASASQLCPLPPGVDVVVEGAPAHAFYAVVDGSVVVHRDGDEVARLGPGELVRRARPARQRAAERDRHHRGATARSCASRATCCSTRSQSAPDGAVRARSLQRRRAAAPAGPSTRPASTTRRGSGVSVGGATVVVVSAGYEGKRRDPRADGRARRASRDRRRARSLVRVARRRGRGRSWLAAPVVGDADEDAQAVLDALAAAGVRPDGVLTFWEDSVVRGARVAAALGLPGNPPEAVDAARSKIRTRELSAELGLPTPRAQRVRSLDELFAARRRRRLPGGREARVRRERHGLRAGRRPRVAPGDLLAGARRRDARSTT